MQLSGKHITYQAFSSIPRTGENTNRNPPSTLLNQDFAFFICKMGMICVFLNNNFSAENQTEILENIYFDSSHTHTPKKKSIATIID